MKKLAALVSASLVAIFLALPATVRADIVDLLTFQSALDAAQAVDPTLKAPSNDGEHDFAVGGFERAQFPPTFSGGHTGFSAQSGPNGNAVKGQVTSTFDNSNPFPGSKQRWTVVCLAVSGMNASMGLVPRDAPPSNTADIRGLTVHDGGPGGTADLYTFWGPDPQDCAAHLLEAVFPISHGNILVHDE